MLFKELSNDQLHQKTVTAAQNEKSATLSLLEHLAEIERRRLYAERGFPSLWCYVHEFLGYSEAQSSERVNAMRLMKKVPEARAKIETGKLTLTSAAKLASHIRRENSTLKETLKLLEEISEKSSRQVEQHLAQKTTVEPNLEKLKVITSKTTRITIDVDQEFMNLLERVRELKGHPGSSTQELIKASMKALVQKRDSKKSKADSTKEFEYVGVEVPLPQEVLDAAAAGDTFENYLKKNPTKDQDSDVSRYIPEKLKNWVRRRSGDCCEYVDPKTKKRCSSRMKLEFDHIIPIALGGISISDNLRHYCRTHNQWAAIQHFGARHMRSFLKN